RVAPGVFCWGLRPCSVSGLTRINWNVILTFRRKGLLTEAMKWEIPDRNLEAVPKSDNSCIMSI
ncbi:MAG: hypothetical protein WBC11_09890, partial [Dehalococcoidia bacterium]